MIVDGFDLDSPLVCEGIVGDGCGGGRIFYIKEEKLFAHDPYTKTDIELLGGLKYAKHLSKSACIISIICKDEKREFDLSTFKD